MSQVVQSLGKIHPVLQILDINNNVHRQLSAHNEVKSTTDFKLIIVLLTKNEIFQELLKGIMHHF